MKTDEVFTWQRRNGYEVSSKGDLRFSAFFAKFPGTNDSIEKIYQTKVKGYPSISEGKGKPPLDLTVNLWEEYLKLWKAWANANVSLMRELYTNAKSRNYILSDCHASTEVNQAHALATILTEWCKK